MEQNDAHTKLGLEQLAIRLIAPICNGQIHSLEDLFDYSKKQETAFLDALMPSGLFIPPGGEPGIQLNARDAASQYLKELEGVRSATLLDQMKRAPIGPLLLNGVLERLRPHYHLFENARELGAQPLLSQSPLLAPYVVKITKMWRKLGAWFWLATQNLDDLPKAAEPMLNMIEWWICLSMPPDEVEKIARFRALTPAQKVLMRSARKEAGKFTEGVILSKSMEVLFRAVPPSLYLAMAMTEPEEKHQRHQLMQAHGIDELEAAFRVAAEIDRLRGIDPAPQDLPPRQTG
ncbi:Type IV secretory pathway, VirB4 component [Pseudomonas orientalis]|nr:Type IV secretory pathway, VirB4 component [Pseudomonas orientalis]